MRKKILMKKNSGFTLMEMMVTIGIIGIMSAIAVPNYISWLPKHRMSGASRDIYSVMQYARMRAVKEKTWVAINFNIGVGAAGTYTVFIDNGSGGGTANDNIQNGAELVIKTGQMPADVNMFSVNFGGVPRTRFDSRGLPNGIGGGRVRLSNASSNLFREIALRVSGNPIIRVSLDGGISYPDP